MTGKALKLLRAYHDLQQNELAERLGISRSYLCEIESEKKEVSLEILKKYAEFFSLPLSSLMLFSENISENSISEKFRLGFADRVMKILEWVSDREQIHGKKGATRI